MEAHRARWRTLVSPVGGNCKDDIRCSRFSAFAVGDARYLLATWHPSTKPATLDLDAATRWTRLDILATSRGGMLDTEGTVEFRAHYRPAVGSQAGGAGSQHEVSRFVRERGRWYYLDGVVADRSSAEPLS